MENDRNRFMARAIELAGRSLDLPGTRPYAGVVTMNGEIVGEGLNHAIARHDPTSHGEIEAIRDACRNLGTTDLAGCELYASCEPCPMCVAAMYRAGIERLYYAVSAEQDERLSREASTRKFSTAQIVGEIRKPAAERAVKGHCLMTAEGLNVLQEWWRRNQEGSA